MKTILVGVDGSDESRRARAKATELCKLSGARMLLALVLPEPEAEAPLMPEFSERDWRLRRTGRALLEEAQREQTAAGVDSTTVSTEGPAAEALAELARAANVDLVAVGHRERGVLARAVFGSTADRLLQISPKPVLVVH